ncbi:type II toxin-antitoxin system VapC family toxin [Rhizobium alarense]|uniref:type II toxin-antitoxin system VapC family toxin n=1 Tax=Rhizobium alarense TaxID=2846851 RepID=UPI0038B4BA99
MRGLSRPPPRRRTRAGTGGEAHPVIHSVIADTTALVGACIGKEPSARVIEACLTGALPPVMGTALLLECRDVLLRAKPFSRTRFDTEERALRLSRVPEPQVPDGASANIPPVTASRTPVVPGKLSGRPARERTAR